MQEDWRFEIEVLDKGNLSDTSIGTTMIDLELRRWSTKSALAKLLLQQEKDITEELIEEHEKALKKEKKQKDAMREKYVRYLRSHKSMIVEA